MNGPEGLPDVATLIRALEDQRFAAIVAGDWEGFAELCDTDLRYVHASGNVDTRESYLAKLRGGLYDYHRIDRTIDRVLVSGDLALVWGTMEADLRSGDRELSLRNIVVAAWVRRTDAWLLLTQQSTPA